MGQQNPFQKKIMQFYIQCKELTRLQQEPPRYI
jgi:hypothetical protein